MFTQDFILNGQGHGPVAQLLAQNRFDAGMMRPYFARNGEKCVTVNTGRFRLDEDPKSPTFNQDVPIFEAVRQRDLMAAGLHSPVFNATALRKEEWVQMDNVVLRAARQRLRAWSDLAAANTYGGFNGMGKMVLEHETMSDPGEAMVDMDATTEGRNDSPLYQLQGLPLPITHSDFWISRRRLEISRNGGTPIDTTMGEACGRRVAEMVERTTIGTVTGVTGKAAAVSSGYGRANTVYGYTNFSGRQTYTSLTAPTGSNPEATVNNVLACLDLLSDGNFYGPFMIYHSTDWNRYLDNDYARLGGNNASQTLRNRLRAIDGITDVRRLDFLDKATNPFTMIFVQMTPDVARAVNGMDITTIQWETMGGLRLHFKVMCIHVPQLRADYNGRCGILHATTS